MNVSLFWAIVWGVCFLLACVAVIWNPAQILMTIISGLMTAAFIVDYIKEKRLK